MEEKYCKTCGKRLIKKEKEEKKHFENRWYCGYKCSGKSADPKKISESVKKARMKNPEKFPSGITHSENVGKSTKGKYNSNLISIKLCSKRTSSKIINRLFIYEKDFGCSNCGWREAIGDVHHIIPKSKGGSDLHDNLTYLCPNCHRLAHNNKIEKIITLTEQIEDRWKKYYYG